MHRHPSRSDRGIALLLSLLLMASLIAAGIGASTVVVQEFRSAASTDRGIEAYYAADIGMERALFTIYNNRVAGTQIGSLCNDSTSTCGQIKTMQPPLTGSLALRNPGAAVALDGTTVWQSAKTLGMAMNQTAQVDLYIPEYLLTNIYISAARSIQLVAPASSPLQGVGTSARAEIQWTYILKDTASTAFNPENSTTRIVSVNNLNSGVNIDLFTGTLTSLDGSPIDIENPSGLTVIDSGENFSDVAGWVIRLKAINGAVPKLTMTAKDNGGSAYGFYTDITVKARGQTTDARFLLQATVPWRLPTGGIFDYALFTESSFDKPS